MSHLTVSDVPMVRQGDSSVNRLPSGEGPHQRGPRLAGKRFAILGVNST